MEVSRSFARDELAASFKNASRGFQLSAVVAGYAEILREGYWAQDGSLAEVAYEPERILELVPEDEDE